ncbi:MAG TPA: OmpA family protein [Spirochaetota bacterium]|nr:OmpA family protein [Spirochaetota bacterium]
MKKALSLIISSLMMIAFLSSCAGTGTQQTKTDTVKTAAADTKVQSGGSMAVDGINSQVKGFSIDGFPGGSAKLDKNEDLENMKKIVGLVKPIIDQVPDGYVMQITGHAANYNSKSEQKRVSTARAAKIYNELKKAGVAAKKMTYKGVGIDEPAAGYADKDAQQRRVSFKAVKK